MGTKKTDTEKSSKLALFYQLDIQIQHNLDADDDDGETFQTQYRMVEMNSTESH